MRAAGLAWLPRGCPADTVLTSPGMKRAEEPPREPPARHCHSPDGWKPEAEGSMNPRSGATAELAD